MIESMLEPHMKNSEAMATQFQVSSQYKIHGHIYELVTFKVSMAFLIVGAGYMTSALIAGWVS